MVENTCWTKVVDDVEDGARTVVPVKVIHGEPNVVHTVGFDLGEALPAGEVNEGPLPVHHLVEEVEQVLLGGGHHDSIDFSSEKGPGLVGDALEGKGLTNDEKGHGHFVFAELAVADPLGHAVLHRTGLMVGADLTI